MRNKQEARTKVNCKILVLLSLSAVVSGLGVAPASALGSNDYLTTNSQSADLVPGILQTRFSGKNLQGQSQDSTNLPKRTILIVSQADLNADEMDVESKTFFWSFVKSATGEARLVGNVPSEGLGKFLLIRAGEDARQTLSVAPGAPEGFNGTAIAAIKAVKMLSSGSIAFRNGFWSLRGFVDSLATRQALLEELSKSVDLNQWNVVIRVLSPTQEAKDTNELGDEVELSNTDLEQVDLVTAFQTCVSAVEEIGLGQAILFTPASATLTEQSLETLQLLGAKLQNCPRAQVHVQGHTDADGPADTNMTLSVKRAESVVSALIEAGVSDTRLYAIGYGETLPVASNQTRAGKAQNRRIVIELVQE